MSFNDILVAAGGFGLYQKFLTFGVLAFSLLVVSVTYWTQVFILLIPPHRCKTSSNDTEWLSSFNESNNLQRDHCHTVQENETLPCSNGIVYDFSLNFPTYSSENNLVCENAYKVYLIHTVYWSGTIGGNIVFGIINDKYGRKRAYQSAVILTLVGDIMTYFCSDYILFTIARFISATGEGSIATIAFVLAMENCIPSKRRLSIFVWSFVYAMTSLSMVWLAYFTFSWKSILMFSWIPTTGAIIVSFFMPESSSWLLTKGRSEEAVAEIQRMSRINGKNLSKEHIISHLQTMTKCEEAHQLTCFQTFMAVIKSPNLRKRILCLGLLWLVACCCYNGCSLEFNFLPFNMYITYSIGALIEVPGNFLVIFTLDKLGRRWLNAGFFVFGGLLGIISANVQSSTIMLVCIMLMRTSYASAYDITFSFSSEVIPTVIRGRAISFIRTCGGLGSTIAPFIVSLAQNDPLLPLSCFGIASIAAGFFMLSLPETAHQQLPQTLEEGENYGKGQSFWLCPFTLNTTENKRGSINVDSIFEKERTTISVEKEVQCIGMKKLSKY